MSSLVRAGPALELEALAEDEHVASFERDVSVRVVRIAFGARAAPGLEVNAVLAGMPELEFPSFAAKAVVDQRLHVRAPSRKRLRGDATLEEEAELTAQRVR